MHFVNVNYSDVFLGSIKIGDNLDLRAYTPGRIVQCVEGNRTVAI